MPHSDFGRADSFLDLHVIARNRVATAEDDGSERAVCTVLARLPVSAPRQHFVRYPN